MSSEKGRARPYAWRWGAQRGSNHILKPAALALTRADMALMGMAYL